MQKLTPNDEDLIAELKGIRMELRRQASYLTDEKLAEKFEVSMVTIQRIAPARVERSEGWT